MHQGHTVALSKNSREWYPSIEVALLLPTRPWRHTVCDTAFALRPRAYQARRYLIQRGTVILRWGRKQGKDVGEGQEQHGMAAEEAGK